MKEYFTTKDRVRHIFVIGLKPIIEDLAKSEAVTTEEAKDLKIAATYLGKANESILNRLGDSYRKKILAMNRDNKIDLVSRYGSGGTTISNVASNDIEPVIEDLRLWKCTGCTKKDFKDCAVYNLSLACDCEVHSYEKPTCPYRVEFLDEKEEEL